MGFIEGLSMTSSYLWTSVLTADGFGTMISLLVLDFSYGIQYPPWGKSEYWQYC